MATSDFTLTSHARPLDCLEHDIALYPRVGLDQARCLHDLLRIGGSHHNLSQNRVGIERDGRDQCLEFLRLEGGSVGRHLLSMQGNRNHRQHREQPMHMVWASRSPQIFVASLLACPSQCH